MQRTLTPEMMDDPAVPPQDLGRALGYIRLVNRTLGGVHALLHHLRAWSRHWPRGRTITLLDIATGSADLPLAALRWAQKANFDLRITGIDKHEETLRFARAHARGNPLLAIIQADALDVSQRFPPNSFDYVHAGLFLHHLPEPHILTVLRSMNTIASKGIIWNDLVRSRVAYRVISALTLGQPPIIRHDARVSVLAGFTREEAQDLMRRADIPYAQYRWSILTHRFTIAGEKPGCWS